MMAKIKQINNIAIIKVRGGYELKGKGSDDIIYRTTKIKEATNFATLNHDYLNPKSIIEKRMQDRDFTYELNTGTPTILV